ncbi:hypothetical protein NC652_035641 [Populus alba x Populus x berolinensis]|nr:hypothetical protein NC652_035641 [Populus alba x Populus x berolinensis]
MSWSKQRRGATATVVVQEQHRIFYDVIGENADRKKGCGRYGHKKEICPHVQHRNEDGRDKQQSGCSNEPE